MRTEILSIVQRPALPARLPRWALVLVLITVPGSTLIVPVLVWWLHRRRQRCENPAMTTADPGGTMNPDPADTPPAATVIARASQRWNRSLHEFFEPLLHWIADARRDFADPEGRRRDARLAAADNLAELERRARDWERGA